MMRFQSTPRGDSGERGGPSGERLEGADQLPSQNGGCVGLSLLGEGFHFHL